MTELKLPSLGEGIEKGTVISISVAVGDTIAQEQILMEVETDKVVVEVPADATGVIEKILVNIGDAIVEGTSIVQLSGTVDTPETKIEIPEMAIEPEGDVLVVQPPATVKIEKKTTVLQKTEIDLKLPSLGEGIEKGTVISISVAVGDTITREQTLMEVETDKVVVEVPADAPGTIEEIFVKVGDEIAEGTLYLKLKTAAVAQSGMLVAEQAKAMVDPSIPRQPKVEPEAKNVVPGHEREITITPPKGCKTYRTSPLARKLAREIGIDINQIVPKPGHSRIGMQDVKHHAKTLNESRNQTMGMAGPQIAPLPDFSKWGSISKKSLSGVTQATSKNMTTTWSEVPHAWLQEKVDITDLEAKRQMHKLQVKGTGGALTITAILVKVLAKALEEFPIFNASLDGNANEIIYKSYINIGVAVDSDRGLLVPVLRDTAKKGLLEISKDLVRLSQKVKTKKATAEDLEGGTFTISNLGGIGTSAIFPLVNHPQAAILGVAASNMEAVWQNGKFEPRLLMPLTIGFDHRIINGADAARFLQRIKQLLEDWFLWSM